MTTATKSIIAGVIAVFIGTMCAATQADARRGGARVRPHVANNVRVYHPSARIAARNVRHAGHWVNGVWIVNGVAASVAVGTASNCDYYYREWKATGSSYWHDRYYENCG